MAAVFPGNVKSFTPKADGVDKIYASHINDLQDEVTAIETELKKSTSQTIVNARDSARLGNVLASNYLQVANWQTWTPTVNTGNSRLSGFTTARYLVQGKAVHLVFGADNVSVTGSTAGYIVVSLPNLGTYQSSRQLYQLYASGVPVAGLAVVTENQLRLFKTGWFGNWANNETGVYIEVTITLGLA